MVFGFRVQVCYYLPFSLFQFTLTLKQTKVYQWREFCTCQQFVYAVSCIVLLLMTDCDIIALDFGLNMISFHIYQHYKFRMLSYTRCLSISCSNQHYVIYAAHTVMCNTHNTSMIKFAQPMISTILAMQKLYVKSERSHMRNIISNDYTLTLILAIYMHVPRMAYFATRVNPFCDISASA